MPRFRSFRAQLLAALLAPVIFINVVAAFHEVKQIKSRFEANLTHQIEALSSSVNEPLVQALWDFDDQQVANIAEGLLATESIAAVTIIDPNGAQNMVRAIEGFDPALRKNVQKYPLIHTSGSEAHNIGTLVLSLNYATVNDAIQEAIFWRVATTGIVVLLIAVISWLMLIGVIRPLVAMADIIPRIGTKDFSDTIPGLSRGDELGTVAQALQHLQDSTSELNILRKIQDEETRQDRHRIYHAVEATQDGIIIFDGDNKITYRNRAATSLLGDLSIGVSIEVSDLGGIDADNAIFSAVAAGTDCELETATELCGKTYHLRLRGRAILDEDGKRLGYCLVAHDQSAQVEQVQKIKYISEHDSLTGVANRHLFEKTLVQYSSDPSGEVGVLIADLDNFKRVNDTLGHPVGDALIQHVARIIADKTGNTELVARLGGDEFAIVSRSSNPVDTLSRIAHDLVSCLAAPQIVGPWVLNTGMSAGIAKKVDLTEDPQEILRRADLALYEAKNKGRGCFEVFEGELEERLNRKTQLEKDLRAAIAEGQISVDYQIQTDIRTGEVVGCEALARWNHKQLGYVSPEEFILIAEEANMIKELTLQVLKDVCVNAKRLEKIGFTGRIAVNLSAKLFGVGLPELIDDILFETGCAPTSIEAEITENVILSRGPQARADVVGLRERQITVALDDFGMGYSSLSYLQQFPVDKLKIDRSFTQQICQKPEARAIIRAVCEMGHALGMSVTAEGVEEVEQFEYLKDSGVDVCQGFIDGRPMSINSLFDLLQKGDPRAMIN